MAAGVGNSAVVARASAPAPSRPRRGRKAPPPPPKPAWWRRHLRLLTALVLVVCLAFGVRLFVMPATDAVAAADAVVVLPEGGQAGLQEGLALVNIGAAPVLVVLGGLDQNGAAADRLCLGGGPVEVLCPAAPSDARGRARALATLIESRGWTTVALVSSRPALSRTALQAKRCTTATVLRRAAASHDGAEAALAAVAEAPRYLQTLVFQQEC